ncbi:3-hydroxyacyl-CoA dehydrogenase NAD-binding domain-containing protein [Brevibacillus sp. NRS-1366]|uniref:3-hydroxyacyl-CoA dehydrogenase NAD-binding domain-containing protein n=1 Tax=Brevibacillus sp. NRS-1366 TaxID=3233899 RepID=UPI003D218270
MKIGARNFTRGLAIAIHSTIRLQIPSLLFCMNGQMENGAFLQRSMNGIRKSVEKLSSKGKMNDSVETVMDRFTTTTNLAEIKDADLVFEVIIENIEKKKGLYNRN